MAPNRPTATVSDRAALRERERDGRRRRAARLQHMRVTVAALETALPVMLTLDADDDSDDDDDDDSALWEAVLDPAAVRVRRLMRRTLALTKEARRLTSAQDRLKRLLREHQVASLVLNGLLAERDPVAKWKADVERWESIVRRHYKPWTLDQCQDIMTAALREVEAFQWSQEKQSTGVSFLGWRDSRRVDHARGAFQFQFEKTFRGYSMDKYVNVAWDIYTHAPTFYDVIVGPRARVVDGVAVGDRMCAVHHEMQRLSSDAMIVRNVEQYPDGGGDVHMVDLVFRVKSERGVIQCLRSLPCPELVRAIDDPSAVWSSNAIWFVWERLDKEDKAFTLRIGGSLAGNDPVYLAQWMLEGFGCVLRSERLATGRAMITNEC